METTRILGIVAGAACLGVAVVVASVSAFARVLSKRGPQRFRIVSSEFLVPFAMAVLGLGGMLASVRPETRFVVVRT